MKNWKISLGLTLGVTIALSSSVIPQPGHSQEFIDSLRTGQNVVATAGMGTNEVTIITLTDVEVLRMELCRQSLGIPDRWEACRREVEARGMLRTEWTVNCRNLSVQFSNNLIDRPQTHRIDPNSRSSRATYHSYVIYDYACGTRYSER